MGKITSFVRKAQGDVRSGFFAEIGKWLARFAIIGILVLVSFLGGIAWDVFGVAPQWVATVVLVAIVGVSLSVMLWLTGVYVRGRGEQRAIARDRVENEREKVALLKRRREEEAAQAARQQELAEKIWQLKPRVMDLQQRYAVLSEEGFKTHLSDLYSRICGIDSRFMYYSVSSDYKAQRNFFGAVQEMMKRESPSHDGVLEMHRKAQLLDNGRFSEDWLEGG